MPVLRILLVDDHTLVRAGIQALLADDPELDVVGEAGRAADVLPAVARLQPDVVFLDLDGPAQISLDLIRQLAARFPATRVILLSARATVDYMHQALQAGAAGYILK